VEAPLSALLEQIVPHLFEIISRSQLVRLTVVYSPAHLARLIVALEGQCYDRDEFDELAGRLFELLLDTSPRRAWTFRDRLNQRLYDRYRAPVRWERQRTGRSR
jgi:hypothetical protein